MAGQAAGIGGAAGGAGLAGGGSRPGGYTNRGRDQTSRAGGTYKQSSPATAFSGKMERPERTQPGIVRQGMTAGSQAPWMQMLQRLRMTGIK